MNTADVLLDEAPKPTREEVADRYLGRQVLVSLTNSRNAASERIQVLCHAREVKRGYGAVRVKVEPVAGRGVLWVDASRVQDAPEREG